jgi:hypothetical protein
LGWSGGCLVGKNFGRADASAWQLMTIPGLGLVVALAYTAVIDDPARFRPSASDPGIPGIVSVLKTMLTTTLVPATTNGWAPFLDHAQSTTVTTVKGGVGELGGYHRLNPNLAPAYVQIFDTSSTVTLGATLPVLSLGLPAGAGGNLEWTMGVHFANAIKVAVTTTATGLKAPGTAVGCNFEF